jgi:hypothetical protein
MEDDFKTYPGEPWHADETDDSVRLFRGHLQMVKMPKHSEAYECYWLEPEQVTWMLRVLNEAEQQEPSP